MPIIDGWKQGNNLAWGIPIFARVVWGQHKFKPGPFYTGALFSTPIAWTAVVFLCFGIILSMFPVGGPNPTRTFPFLSFTFVLSALSRPLSPSPQSNPKPPPQTPLSDKGPQKNTK